MSTNRRGRGGAGEQGGRGCQQVGDGCRSESECLRAGSCVHVSFRQRGDFVKGLKGITGWAAALPGPLGHAMYRVCQDVIRCAVRRSKDCQTDPHASVRPCCPDPPPVQLPCP